LLYSHFFTTVPFFILSTFAAKIKELFYLLLARLAQDNSFLLWLYMYGCIMFLQVYLRPGKGKTTAKKSYMISCYAVDQGYTADGCFKDHQRYIAELIV